MFLKAGLVSLLLLLASRVLGLARESAVAAAFGTSGMADVAVLMFTLPDWLAGVLASGMLAYALLPAWAGAGAAEVQGLQRRVAGVLLVTGLMLGLLIMLFADALLHLLAPGLPVAWSGTGRAALAAAGAALPLALLAALWTTRLQHERDFTGLYGANLVVNGVLVCTIAAVSGTSMAGLGTSLGMGLMAAMVLRLAWLQWRLRPHSQQPSAALPGTLPPGTVWGWAAIGAGLPLALPVVARSMASTGGEGALATFNYAWKLVELPLVMAVQLVAVMAFPAIARALNEPGGTGAAHPAIRSAFALAFALACAAAAALLVGADALAQALFGWGRMEAADSRQVAEWGRTAAWGLLPQGLLSVAVTVLASRRRLQAAALAWVLALVLLVTMAGMGVQDGGRWMVILNVAFTLVAAITVTVAVRGLGMLLPWRAFGGAAAMLATVSVVAAQLSGGLVLAPAAGLAAATAGAVLVLVAAALSSADLRRALAK